MALFEAQALREETELKRFSKVKAVATVMSAFSWSACTQKALANWPLGCAGQWPVGNMQNLKWTRHSTKKYKL